MTKTCLLVSTIALIMSFSLPAYHVLVLEPELQNQIEYHFVQPAKNRLESDQTSDPFLITAFNKGQQHLSSTLKTSSWLIASATSGYFIVQLLLLIWVRSATRKQQQTEKKMQQIAYFDPLTKKPNRIKFHRDLTCSLVEHNEVGVLIIDLARFKVFNDSLGYDAGDMILIEMSQRIQNVLRKEESLYRLGGDSFGLIISNFGHPNRLTLLASEILRKMRAPYTLMLSGDFSNELTINGHIGIAISNPNNRYDAQELQRNAEVALALSVEKGGDHYHFFTFEMMQEMRNQVELEEQLYRALQFNEFVLHYQPQLNLNNNIVSGFEALLRWQHKSGLKFPDTFIEAAERSGLIIGIGKWVLKSACEQGELWRQKYYDLTMAVNISSHQFSQANFIDIVDQILASTQFPARLLKLELTETTMLENGEENIRKLEALKLRGIQLSIDDFGTGYSSLSYLKNFPVDQIKIDRSFITHLLSDHSDAALVESIITIGQKLGIATIAEGVETCEQRDFLISKGCQQIQGYLVSKPAAAEQITEMLKHEPMVFAKREKNYFLMHVAS